MLAFGVLKFNTVIVAPTPANKGELKIMVITDSEIEIELAKVEVHAV